jgi:hypothetical protein
MWQIDRAPWVEQDRLAQPSPAPSTSPYENPPPATKPLNWWSERRPAAMSPAHVGRRSRRGRRPPPFHVAVDPARQDRDLAGSRRDERRGGVLVRSKDRRGARPGSSASRMRAYPGPASGLSRSLCSARGGADQAR